MRTTARKPATRTAPATNVIPFAVPSATLAWLDEDPERAVMLRSDGEGGILLVQLTPTWQTCSEDTREAIDELDEAIASENLAE